MDRKFDIQPNEVVEKLLVSDSSDIEDNEDLSEEQEILLHRFSQSKEDQAKNDKEAFRAILKKQSVPFKNLISLAETDGKDFNPSAFPISEEGVVRFKKTVLGGQSIENSVDEVRGSLKTNSMAEDKIVSVLTEVLVNDEAALSTILRKLKLEQDFLRELEQPDLPMETYLKCISHLCRSNNSLRKQISSVKTHLDYVSTYEDSPTSKNSVRTAMDFLSHHSSDTREFVSDSHSKVTRAGRNEIRFTVIRLNWVNKNSLRSLLLDLSIPSLLISKGTGDRSRVDDVFVTCANLISCEMSNDRPDELLLDLWKDGAISGKSKQYRFKFVSQAERERFYRLVKAYLVQKLDLKYDPKPLVLENPQMRRLYDELTLPIEEIAAEVHHSWVLHRLEDGWSYGTSVNNEGKLHPSLVPFAELHVTEQRSNKEVVKQMIESMYALGFHVSDPTHDIAIGSHVDDTLVHNTYQQQRISGDLLQLVEFLAENMHDIWADQRMKDGWIYGPHRDNEGKLHPCLKPYHLLEEGQKQDDREAALSVIGSLINIGFQITKAKH